MISVHLYQKYFIDYLVKKFGSLPRKIYCFSDGASTLSTTRMTLVYLPSGTSLPLHTERGHVMELVAQ